MRWDIDFYYAIIPKGAKALIVRVGRGEDGTLWFEAPDLGLSSEALQSIRERDKRLIVMDPRDGSVFVEAQAVIETCGSLEMEKRLLAAKEALLDRLHPANFRA